MFEPSKVLMDEHRVIERVLDALTAATPRDMPFSFYERAIDFIVNYADGCHHDKEEKQYFPALVGRGVPKDFGPIGCMLEEHEAGRRLVRAMRDAVAKRDAKGVKRAASEYVDLLRAHIQKEDNVLFPLGRGVLLPADNSRLEGDFRGGADGCCQKYVNLADELLQEARKAP